MSPRLRPLKGASGTCKDSLAESRWGTSGHSWFPQGEHAWRQARAAARRGSSFYSSRLHQVDLPMQAGKARQSWGAGAMQQVADWLEKLGLGQYAERFAENDISFAVLPDLTDQHLKEIGVSLGHRLQLLRAIAEFPSGAKDAPKAATVSAASAASQDTAERRQVTVMFSDLVGSTALSARMDPEDLREVISTYQKCVAGTVQRFGGFVAKYMGDGVLVYFGGSSWN